MAPQKKKPTGQADPPAGEPLDLPIPDDPKAKFACYVVRRLQARGFQAVWAGGCVRDLIMGLQPVDYDVATDARPGDVRRLFDRTVPVGAQFGVVLVVGRRKEEGEVQVATFRREGPYSDGRHPDRVEYCSMQQDALRRDFTINGMFYDPIARVLYDFVGGREDLKRGVIRAIGDPRERFAEDKLRLIRAIRFAARFGFSIEPDTLSAVREMADQIAQVSAERILRELQLLLQHPSRATALELLADVGLLRVILPELVQVEHDRDGDPLHAACTDLWQHTLKVCRFLDRGWTEARKLAKSRRGRGWRRGVSEEGEDLPLPVAFAGALHLISEPAQEAVPYERLLRMKRRTPLRTVCARLRVSNELRDAIEWLSLNVAVILQFSRRRPHEWKPLLADRLAPQLLAFSWAEAQALGAAYAEEWSRAAELYTRVSDVEIDPPPLLTGQEVIELGVPRGPQVGELLRQLRVAQLDGQLRDRDQARAWLKRQAEQLRSGAEEQTD